MTAPLLGWICCAPSSSALAQASNTLSSMKLAPRSLVSTSVSTSVQPPVSEEAHSESNGELRFESLQYLAGSQSSTAPASAGTSAGLNPGATAPSNQARLLSARFAYYKDGSQFQNTADLGAATFFVPGESHLLVNELATSPQTKAFTGNTRVVVGRKKYLWSRLDTEWTLGVVQPYYELDALRPEQQGLTGAFLEFDQENFQLVGFASPFFVPNMGTTIHESDGTLSTQSRWKQLPPAKAGLGNTTNAIRYDLSIPPTSEVINHAGFALMTRIGNRDQGFWGAGSVAYKPVNELLIGRTLRRSIATGEMDVRVAPAVAYHSVAGVDVGFTGEDAGVVLSYLQDTPESSHPEEGWALQQLSGLKAAAAGVFWKVPALKSRNVLLKADYLKTDSGQIEDVVTDGSRDVLSRDQSRLKFANAFRVRAQGEIARFFRRPLVGQVSWLYDQDQGGSMLNSELQFLAGKSWAVLAGADFLGVQNEDDSTAFLNQFRANDRVYGGMSYVF